MPVPKTSKKTRAEFKKQLNREIRYLEIFVTAKKKLLIKLSWVTILIIMLIIVLNIYLEYGPL
jgi:hypothetical protein